MNHIDFGFEESRNLWKTYKSKERQDREMFVVLMVFGFVVAVSVFHFFVLPALLHVISPSIF